MHRHRLLALSLALAALPAHALGIKSPERAENGAVIPIEITLDTPLTAGQQLDVFVDDQFATRLSVSEGRITSFSARIKGTRNTTTVVAVVQANGSELARASQVTTVTIPSPVSGSPTAPGPIRARNTAGEVKLLMPTENGLAGTVTLQGAGLRAEITGSAGVSRNPLFAVKGDFSGEVTATASGQSVQVAEAPKPAPVRASVAPETGSGNLDLGSAPPAIGPAPSAPGNNSGADGWQMALGVLKSYSNAAASVGNYKPTKQVAALEILAGNSPQEIFSALKVALLESIERSPTIARSLAHINSLQNLSAQDALTLLKPALIDAASRKPDVAKKLAILEALTASAPGEAMSIMEPILTDAAIRRMTSAR